MSSSSLALLALSKENVSRHRAAVIGPALLVFVLFTAAALVGEPSTDEGLKTVLRFLSLTLLATAMFTAAAASLRYINRSRQRLLGMAAAIGLGVGSGLVWTVTLAAFGFGIYMMSCLLTFLMVTKELNERLKRRRATEKK